MICDVGWISTIGSCKPGENDDLVIDICGALSAILDNANLYLTNWLFIHLTNSIIFYFVLH